MLVLMLMVFCLTRVIAYEDWSFCRWISEAAQITAVVHVIGMVFDIEFSIFV